MQLAGTAEADDMREDAPALDVATLYREHASFLTGFVRRMGVADGDVDDVVQETFVVAHRLGGYRPGPAKPRSWLGAIGTRVISNTRRRRAKWNAELDATGLERAAERERQFDQAAAKEALQRVQDVLDTLPPDQAAVFVLFELAGETCESIASALDVPLGTVHSRLFHARRHFKESYARAQAQSSTPNANPHDPRVPRGR